MTCRVFINDDLKLVVVIYSGPVDAATLDVFTDIMSSNPAFRLEYPGLVRLAEGAEVGDLTFDIMRQALGRMANEMIDMITKALPPGVPISAFPAPTIPLLTDDPIVEPMARLWQAASESVIGYPCTHLVVNTIDDALAAMDIAATEADTVEQLDGFVELFVHHDQGHASGGLLGA